MCYFNKRQNLVVVMVMIYIVIRSHNGMPTLKTNLQLLIHPKIYIKPVTYNGGVCSVKVSTLKRYTRQILV